MSLVSNRYAKALYDIAQQESAVDDYKEELTAVAGIYANESVFRNYLLDLKISTITKKQTLQNVFQDKVKANTLNFLMLLLDKGRIQYLPGICTEYIRIWDEEKNILTITVFSPFSIDSSYIESISDKFRKRYKATAVNVKIVIDPSLLGGIKVSVGDKLYDMTIKEKLSELRSAMLV